MSMNDAVGRGMKFEINVTPLIDVLLVLLIIFMVIVPALPRGEAAALPKTCGDQVRGDAVVLEVRKDSAGAVRFTINQQVVAREDLAARLAAIYANRAPRVLFVKGDDELKFTQIAEVIDLGHAAGIDRIALLTPRLARGL